LIRFTSHPTLVKVSHNPPSHFPSMTGFMEGLILLLMSTSSRGVRYVFRSLRPPQAHMETQWAQGRSSLPSLAQEMYALSPRLQVLVSLRLVGISSSFLMDQRPLIPSGCVLEETPVSLETGPAFPGSRPPVFRVDYSISLVSITFLLVWTIREFGNKSDIYPKLLKIQTTSIRSLRVHLETHLPQVS